MPSSSSADRKRAETRRLSEAVRSFVTDYKAWMEDALRREKLTLPQLRLLRAIMESKGESAAAIARTLQVTPQTLQTMLERAVRERWIVRSHSATNQRILTATLTTRGEAVLGRGMALAVEYEEMVWAGVGTDTVRQCADILLRGVANMQRLRTEAADTTPRKHTPTNRS